ncbi:MAG TPA: cytochrome c oxidase assembly factor Coa1 family protein [Candidatus Polarisedimenticolia bacterium]|nr:cytochrome c oxidase assembly factor Coa1 family protein [Candidatus Polarisedimenticolia bacterium]
MTLPAPGGDRPGPPGRPGAAGPPSPPSGFAGLLARGAFRLALGMMKLVFRIFRSSGAYQEAAARALADPRVRRALGAPLETGLMVQGGLQVGGGSGRAAFATPLRGPLGRGRLEARGFKEGGRWDFVILRVVVEATGETIDLLEEGPADGAAGPLPTPTSGRRLLP